MLYFKLTKALYGIFHSAILFYNNPRNQLEEIGFEINPYDPCVANITIHSSQMTVCWNVDDLKVSHKEESVIDASFLNICKIFVNGTNVSRGKVNGYLVMDMEWSQHGTMIVSMIKCLQNIIDDSPKVIRSTSTTYTAEYLFTVRDKKDRKLLPEDQVQHFHTTVDQFLFLCMRSCPDIHPLVDFLTTRVRSPDKDDWGI